jgi:hypothetical protein
MENFLKEKLEKLRESIANLNALISDAKLVSDAPNKTEGEPNMAEDNKAAVAELEVEKPVVVAEAEVVTEVAAVVEAPVVAVEAPVVVAPVAEASVEAVAEPVVEAVAEAPVVEVVVEAAQATKSEFLKKSMSSEDVADLGFSEAELAFATKFSFVDLVKFVASSSAELASFKEVAAKAEADERLQERLATLTDEGILFSGDKAEAQKVEITDMTEEAFGSYVEKAKEFKAIFESGAGLDKTAIEAAKASVGKFSVEPNLVVKKPDYRLI